MCSPAILPFFSRMVKVSSSACVGCSCAPSPPLITLASSRSARNCAAPALLCRSTMMSASSASRFFAVSFSVSPFVRLDVLAEILITSALRRNAASSNDARVRVLGSTKKFTSVLPRSAGTFFTSRVPTSLNADAVSRSCVISAALRAAMETRSLRCHAGWFCVREAIIRVWRSRGWSRATRRHRACRPSRRIAHRRAP